MKNNFLINYLKERPLLLFAFAITGLWVTRIILTGKLYNYGFIVWNIFLAAVPLLLEKLFPLIKKSRSGIAKNAGMIVTALFWVLFLPNAFYILTDFMHLNAGVLVNIRGQGQHYAVHYNRGDGMYAYDSLLLFLATLYGAYVGGLSLTHGYKYIRTKLSKAASISLVTFIMLLSSTGIYIGRYGRWNSWDAVLKPWSIIADLWNTFSHAASRGQFLEVIFSLFIFHAVSFYLVQKYVKEISR